MSKMPGYPRVGSSAQAAQSETGKDRKAQGVF